MLCRLSGMENIPGPIIYLVHQFLNHGIQFILEGKHDNRLVEWTNNKFQRCLHS